MSAHNTQHAHTHAQHEHAQTHNTHTTQHTRHDTHARTSTTSAPEHNTSAAEGWSVTQTTTASHPLTAPGIHNPRHAIAKECEAETVQSGVQVGQRCCGLPPGLRFGTLGWGPNHKELAGGLGGISVVHRFKGVSSRTIHSAFAVAQGGNA